MAFSKVIVPVLCPRHEDRWSSGFLWQYCHLESHCRPLRNRTLFESGAGELAW
jgi:hypothetical protein